MLIDQSSDKVFDEEEISESDLTQSNNMHAPLRETVDWR